jgi:hypothetical protein
LLEEASATAGLVEALDEGDAVAASTEANGGRKPAEARADHDGVGTVRPRLHRVVGRIEKTGVGAAGEAVGPAHEQSGFRETGSG